MWVWIKKYSNVNGHVTLLFKTSPARWPSQLRRTGGGRWLLNKHAIYSFTLRVKFYSPFSKFILSKHEWYRTLLISYAPVSIVRNHLFFCCTSYTSVRPKINSSNDVKSSAVISRAIVQTNATQNWAIVINITPCDDYHKRMFSSPPPAHCSVHARGIRTILASTTCIDHDRSARWSIVGVSALHSVTSIVVTSTAWLN